MKTSITFSLDLEIAELIRKEQNRSSLINNYLKNYFDLGRKDIVKELEKEADSVIKDLI